MGHRLLSHCDIVWLMANPNRQQKVFFQDLSTIYHTFHIVRPFGGLVKNPMMRERERDSVYIYIYTCTYICVCVCAFYKLHDTHTHIRIKIKLPKWRGVRPKQIDDRCPFDQFHGRRMLQVCLNIGKLRVPQTLMPKNIIKTSFFLLNCHTSRGIHQGPSGVEVRAPFRGQVSRKISPGFTRRAHELPIDLWGQLSQKEPAWWGRIWRWIMMGPRATSHPDRIIPTHERETMHRADPRAYSW